MTVLRYDYGNRRASAAYFFPHPDCLMRSSIFLRRSVFAGGAFGGFGGSSSSGESSSGGFGGVGGSS